MNVINETVNGTYSARNIIAGGIIGRQKSGQNPYYFLKNGHGDVTRALRGTSTIAEYDYDAFGNQTVEEGSINNPIRYAGEYFDNETGFIYLRARYYDPEVGRFISEDPIRDGLNWYVYCGNNPVTFIDPSGLTVTRWDLMNMSSEDFNKINVNDKRWRVASNKGDTEGMTNAAASSKKIREKYLTENQEVLDNGYISETYSKTVSKTGNGGAYKVTTTTTYERIYKELGMTNEQEINIINVSGKVDYSQSGYKCVGYKGMVGQMGNNSSLSGDGSSYYFDVNLIPIDDTQHEITAAAGHNVTFYFQRGNGKKLNFSIVNNVYLTSVYDETNPNPVPSEVNLYDIAVQILQRPER